MNINKKEIHRLIKQRILGVKNSEELYNECNKIIYQIAFSILKNKEDAEDVAQNVLVKIIGLPIEKLPKDKETTWLYSVTKNETIDYLRKQKQEINIDDIYEVLNDTWEEDVISKQTYKEMIRGLNKQEQEIISLKVLSGFSFKEISQLLNMPIGTVQWKYYKIIRILRVLIGNISICILSLIGYIVSQYYKKDIKEEIVEQNNLKENENQMEDTTELNKEELKNDIQNQIVSEGVIVIPKSKEINVVDTCLLSISGLSLLFSIILFIFYKKYQQNRKNNTSK